MERESKTPIPSLIALGCYSLVLTCLGIGTVFAWILRDGLGPDMVESSGWSAVLRCGAIVWRLLLLLSPVLLLGGFFSWAGRRNEAGKA